MKSLLKYITASALLVSALSANADHTFTVDPNAGFIGFMNVTDLPSNGGGYEFGSSWGVADLVSSFSGTTVTLAVNNINDPSSYWYTPSGMPGATGNKIMDANLYVEDTNGSWAGQTITFTGHVVSNTLTTNANYTCTAFIKDFAPDFSSSVAMVTNMVSGTTFSITLATINDTTRHIQYGFETIGPDVWVTDATNYGTVQISAVGGAATPVALTPSKSNGSLNLSFPTQSGFAYTVQYRTNLSSGTWQSLTVTNGTGSTAVVTDTNKLGRRFYRLSIQ